MPHFQPAPVFPLRLEPTDPTPAYVQLERQVRIAVADGTLQPGDQLPSVRRAAHTLGVSTSLARQRRDRIQTLARQLTVRALALGFGPTEALEAVAREFAERGQPASGDAGPSIDAPDEAALLSARNQLRGTITAIIKSSEVMLAR